MILKTHTTQLKKVIIVILLTSTWLFGAIKQHTFTVAGLTTGETGSGTVTWDDTVIVDGSSITWDPPTNIISISLTITGGGTVGGTTTFTKGDCTSVNMQNFPDFTGDLAFRCDNGVHNLVDLVSHLLIFNGQAMRVTPGTTVTVTPTNSTVAAPIPPFAYVLLALFFSGASILRLRK
jgi:hypothetical protein